MTTGTVAATSGTINAYRRRRPFPREPRDGQPETNEQPDTNDTNEQPVFSLLQELANYPELLEYVANKLRTLGDIYNMRCVFRAATTLTNNYIRRAIINRNTIAANNKIALQTHDVDSVGAMCSICNTTLPPVKDFSMMTHCNFPFCMHPAMLRPVCPLVSLHTSGSPVVVPRQVLLTNRNAMGARTIGCKMLVRYRQYSIGEDPEDDWTIGHRAYTLAYAHHIMWPVALSPWKLVQFSVAVRINRCTCGRDELSTTPTQCYHNHLNGNPCTAAWSPWSKPSLPIFPPSKYEAGFIKRRSALVSRRNADQVVEEDSPSQEF